jgi:exodeoxyribonuclease VII large subunit
LSAQLPNTVARRVQVADTARRLGISAATHTAQRHQALASLRSQLELLNPQRTLERGYTIVTDARGRIVRAPKDLHAREIVTMRLAKGVAEVGIASVQPSLE